MPNRGKGARKQSDKERSYRECTKIEFRNEMRNCVQDESYLINNLNVTAQILVRNMMSLCVYFILFKAKVAALQ